MEAVHGPTGVFGTNRVSERNAGGNKQNAEAFRRALTEERGQSGDRADEQRATRERPLPRRLQQRDAADRREPGQAVHVDVIA